MIINLKTYLGILFNHYLTTKGKIRQIKRLLAKRENEKLNKGNVK